MFSGPGWGFFLSCLSVGLVVFLSLFLTCLYSSHLCVCVHMYYSHTVNAYSRSHCFHLAPCLLHFILTTAKKNNKKNYDYGCKKYCSGNMIVTGHGNEHGAYTGYWVFEGLLCHMLTWIRNVQPGTQSSFNLLCQTRSASRPLGSDFPPAENSRVQSQLIIW